MPTCDIALELFAQLTYNHARTRLGRCQTAMENRYIFLILNTFISKEKAFRSQAAHRGVGS